MIDGFYGSWFNLLFLGILIYWIGFIIRFAFYNDKEFIDKDNLINNDSFKNIRNSLFTSILYIIFDSGIGDAYNQFKDS